VHPCKLSHLRCFVSAAELGSISAAAKRLHRTPSAISMTISNLETQFGRALFEAGNKSRLTPFGNFVLETAREQVQQFDRSVRSMRAYASNEIGRVDIAAVPSFATAYLPGLVADFMYRFPQVELSIRDDSSAQINRLVEQGQIDIGIASPAPEFHALAYRPLLTDPLGVVCSRAHPLNQLDRPLDWADLAGWRFIANGTCAQIQDSRFRELVAASEIDVQNTTSLLALVAAEFGITTLPRLAVPQDRADVRFLPTRYAALERGIGLITYAGRSLSPAAECFVETLEAAFQAED